MSNQGRKKWRRSFGGATTDIRPCVPKIGATGCTLYFIGSAYQKAAQQGHMAAQRMLALIFSRPTPQGGIDEVWFRQLAPPEGVANTPSARSQTTAWFQSDGSVLIDWLPAQQQAPGMVRSFSAWP
jgi:hypothetical protein